MSARYFRASDSVYESIRSQLDSAWGYPSPDGKTQTAIVPAAFAPRDAQGRVYLAVESEFCNYVLPAHLLPQMLANGAVEEITAAQYQQALQG